MAIYTKDVSDKELTPKQTNKLFNYMMFIYTHRFQIKSFVEGTIKLIKQLVDTLRSLRIVTVKNTDNANKGTDVNATSNTTNNSRK